MRSSFTLLIVLSFSAAILFGQNNSDWNKIRKAWDRYLKNPSPDNADSVSRLLPQKQCTPPAQLSRHIEKGLNILERRIIKADSSSVVLAFRLYPITDGSFGENVDIILGRLIRIKPTLFLQVLDVNRLTVQRLDCLVGNYGDDYVDNETKQRAETIKRVKALMTVRDSSLFRIRDECIKELNK